jgi:hypothetical protein
MQRLEFSVAVRPIQGSLGVKELISNNGEILKYHQHHNWKCWIFELKKDTTWEIQEQVVG